MDKKRIAFFQRIFGLIIFVCFLIIFLCPTSYAKDKVNIDLVGAWGNRGAINCVKVYQDNNHNKYAYCGTENGLLIIDAKDPNSPKEITFLGIGDVNDIAFYHSDNEAFTYAVLAGRSKGIFILDISDPKRPTYAGQSDTQGYASGVAISGNYAFVADVYNGLLIIDCSDPSGPVFAGGFDTQGYALGVAISGNYAFVADYDNGLVIIDCSDPSGPVFAGGFDTQGYARGVAISGNYAFVADVYNGLLIIDCSDPSGPVFAGGFDTQGSALGVAISGNYAFVADDDNGLVIIDCSDPSGPVFAGGFDTQGYAYGVAVSGDYAFVADGGNGLVIIDCSDPSGPVFAGGFDTQGYARGVAISGDYAFVADDDNGLVIIDCSDPSDPVFAGGFNTQGYALGVAISGDYAFVADGYNGLVIIDWSDPSGPVFVGGFDTQGYARGVAISGNYAFVADGDNGLVIIDWSDPSGPVFAGGFNTQGRAEGVAISGDYAFVADTYNGLVIIDCSDPYHPVFAGGFDTQGLARGVAISGDYAFVADDDNGVPIFHVTKTLQKQGNLILCPSGPSSAKNPLWYPSQDLANLAYFTFLKQNYYQYFTYYLNPDPHQDIDGDGTHDPQVVDDFIPTKEDFHNTITDWAYNRLNTGPLYLYLTGIGTENAFQISPPNDILIASDRMDPNITLKNSLDTFQEGTNRDVICLFEFASSGSFCDDLIAPDTLPYSRTIITCTDSGASYLDQTGQKSFTGQLLTLIRDSNQIDPGLFEDTNISYYERVRLMQGLFSQARDIFRSQGHPFSTQPPQMVTAQGSHTLTAITLSATPDISAISSPKTLTITRPDKTITLTATGHYLDGDLILSPDQLFYQSSDPTILLVTPEGKAFPNPDTNFNGKATILATIIDPNFTQSPGRAPDLLCSDPNHPCLGGVTGRINLTVDIPTEKFPAWKEKDNLPLAIIVAGEKEKQDYLWWDTHTISHYAYLTLLDRGYSRSRIQFLTHLKEELRLDPTNEHDTDLDGDKDPNNDIDGIPTREDLENAILWAKDKGTDSLTIFLADHGIKMEEDGNQQGGFYLNPDEILTPHDLDLWLDDLQNENPNLKITIIIESCHSGLFIESRHSGLFIKPLKGENRIIITSTGEDQSYIYAQGLVSFSYYLFTYLQSGANLASAYDSARDAMLEIDRFLHEQRQTLNEPHQSPQLNDRDQAKGISLGGPFLISQDQPVVTYVDIYPDPNNIHIDQNITIQARASDMDGIDPNGVWALINATYSPPVFSGDPERPVVDLPKIKLQPKGEGIFEGTSPDFEYRGAYSILVFARDTKGNVSQPFAASLSVKGEAQDRALLIAGWDPDPYRFTGLLGHAQWVLKQKRFSDIKRLIAPSLDTLKDKLSEVSQGTDKLFVYFLGYTEQGTDNSILFRLNPTQVLSPDTLNNHLDNLSAQHQVVLIDAPQARAFFKVVPDRIYIAGSSLNDLNPSLDLGGYCAFSHFFFTCLYRGASVFQAYNSSCWAIQYYSEQTPDLDDGHWDQVAKATYLGSPFVIKTAGPRITVPSDRNVWGLETLWADTNITDPNSWVLIKTPRRGTITRTLLPANDRYETTFDFDVPGAYTVIAYVEDPNGLLDYDRTTYTAISPEPYPFYPDSDGDGYGDPHGLLESCVDPGPEYVLNPDDCDDGYSLSYPGAPEIYDGLDNNCDNSIDETYHFTCELFALEDPDGIGSTDTVTIGLGSYYEFTPKDEPWDANMVRMYLMENPWDANSPIGDMEIFETGPETFRWYIKIERSMPDVYPQLQWDPNCFGPGYYYLQRGWDEEGKIIIRDMIEVDSYQAKEEDGMDILSFTLIWCLNPCREKKEDQPPDSLIPFLPHPNTYHYPYSINHEHASFLFHCLRGNMLYTPWKRDLISLFMNTGSLFMNTRLYSRPYSYFQNYPYSLNYPYYQIYPYYQDNQNYRNYSYYQNHPFYQNYQNYHNSMYYLNYPYYQNVLPFSGRQPFLPYSK